MCKRINCCIFCLFLVVVVLQGCSFIYHGIKDTYYYSYEETMNGWDIRGVDLDNPPVQWFIQRSDTMAYNGNFSVEFYLNNINDAGKIWIEKVFNVKPMKKYEVEISYKFATADFGSFNNWRIITGVLEKSPETRNDLIYQERTGNGYDYDVGYVWLNKSYRFTINSLEEGELYVIIGIWGTWETPRTYYLDDVYINFTKKISSNAYTLTHIFSDTHSVFHHFRTDTRNEQRIT